MRKQRILLVDTSSVLHSVKYGIKKRLSNKEKSTFIIFGFFMKLHALAKKTNPDVIVFATDGHRDKSIRRKMYSPYKGNRDDKRTDEQIELDNLAYPQFNEITQEVLPFIGYKNVFGTDGLEADDIIGRICVDYKQCQIIIVTTDHDMYQLLSKTTCILDSKSNKYFTKKDFMEKYNIKPKQWRKVKSMAGCASDNVRGVPGVGELTALKFIRNEIPEHYKAYKELTSKNGLKIIKRNRKLVVLPFKGTPKYKIRKDKVAKVKIKKIAKKYGFKSITSNIDIWARTLKAWGK